MKHQSSQPDQILKGIAIAVAGFFLVTVMGVLSKMLTGLHSPIEIAFYRNALAVVVCAVFIITQKRYDLLRTKRPAMLALRGLIGISGLIVVLSAVQALPMSTATSLFFAATLMIPVFATILLKERVGWHRWGAVIIGMIGVVIVAQPSAAVTMTGVGLGLLAAFFIACAHIILRVLRDENSVTVSLSYFVFGFVFTAPFMPFIATMPTLESALILFGIGVTGGLFQLMLTLALKYAPASVINPFNYTGLVWAVLFDMTIFSLMPATTTIVGAVIIIGANVYITWREARQRQREKLLQL